MRQGALQGALVGYGFNVKGQRGVITGFGTKRDFDRRIRGRLDGLAVGFRHGCGRRRRGLSHKHGVGRIAFRGGLGRCVSHAFQFGREDQIVDGLQFALQVGDGAYRLDGDGVTVGAALFVMIHSFDVH